MAPKIPAQCPCVSEMKMSPEDNSVPLGPKSRTGGICTSAGGLWRPGEEGGTLLTKVAWLGVSSQVGSPAQKGQSPKVPTTGPSAQRGRALRQIMPMFRGIFTAWSKGHPVLSSWVTPVSMGSFPHLRPCALSKAAVLGSTWTWSALPSTAIKRAFALYHFSNELACLSGYKEICGKAGSELSAPL